MAFLRFLGPNLPGPNIPYRIYRDRIYRDRINLAPSNPYANIITDDSCMQMLITKGCDISIFFVRMFLVRMGRLLLTLDTIHNNLFLVYSNFYEKS